MKQKFLVVLMSLFLSIPVLKAADVRVENEDVKNKTEMKEADKLVVVWTSGDKEVAMKMVFMYTYNAKKQGWWDDVTLLVWGLLQNFFLKIKTCKITLRKCKNLAFMLWLVKLVPTNMELPIN